MTEKKKHIVSFPEALHQAEEILEGKSPVEVLAQQIIRQQETEERILALEGIYLNQKEIFTLDEAASYLQISRSALYKLTSRKQIPHYKPNKYVFFERSELDNWIRSSVINTEEQLSNQANAYIMARPFHI